MMQSEIVCGRHIINRFALYYMARRYTKKGSRAISASLIYYTINGVEIKVL